MRRKQRFIVRAFEHGFLFSNAGMAIFEENTPLELILAYLNSNVVQSLVSYINNTLNFNQGDIKKIPIIFDESANAKIMNLSLENIRISKDDWDSFETSWDFTKHPLLKFPADSIRASFEQWEAFAKNRFNQLKENEEELNRIFIDIWFARRTGAGSG